ncbi:hypothetical protein BJ944DRAFT_238490 [Cunninghamella echinulata]|nr:hypothetical protein BJ944DRAFT_238490 [Cunninghamella echinulata]
MSLLKLKILLHSNSNLIILSIKEDITLSKIFKGNTREQAALSVGHSYKSDQQFKSYASTFDDLDAVGVILEKKSDPIIELNPYIQGLKSNITDPNVFRLCKNEQDEIVKPIEKEYNNEINKLKEEFIAKRRLRAHHMNNIKDMAIEEPYTYLTNYFKKYYDTTLAKRQFDSVIDKMYAQHKAPGQIAQTVT